MQIQDEGGKIIATYACLQLTVPEAEELRDKIELLLDDQSADRHEHVSSADFQTEITVWLDRGEA